MSRGKAGKLKEQYFKLLPGFTLLEISIVIGIFALLSVGAVVSYRGFEKRLKVESVARNIVSTLQVARNRTTASVGATNYGVHFESNQFILFDGTEYVPEDPSNEVRTLLSGVEIYNIAINGGGADVIYNRVRGSAIDSGTVGVRLIDDPSISLTVDIPRLAQAGLSTLVTENGGRNTDTRHVHFDLGWSIQGAETLRLVFKDVPSPDTEVNVSMEDYFNADETSFDWKGTTNVGGENQTLRIYTHSLDSLDTILSIRRDGRYNTKAVEIAIDGRSIVSYAVDGTATVDLWGGTMEIQ